jgi:hypothetical protein
MRVSPQDCAALAAIADLLSLKASPDEFSPDEPPVSYASIECLPSPLHEPVLGRFQT